MQGIDAANAAWRPLWGNLVRGAAVRFGFKLPSAQPQCIAGLFAHLQPALSYVLDDLILGGRSWRAGGKKLLLLLLRCLHGVVFV